MGAERTLYERVRFDADSHACLLRPQSLGTGTHHTPTIDMGGVPGAAAVRHESYDEVVFCILVGAGQAATNTLDVEVQECTGTSVAQNGAAAGARTLASGAKAIVQLTAGDDYATLNMKYLIYVRADELDVDAATPFRYLQVEITVGGVDGEAFLIAVEADRSTASGEPVTHTNIPVAQIIT